MRQRGNGKGDQKVINKMLIAVNRVKQYMLTHGIFTLLQYKGGMFKVFKPTACSCPVEERSNISGLLFYKWAKAKPKDKRFERLIIHIVCYKCGQKGPIEVFDKGDYDQSIRDNALFKRFRLTTSVLK